MTSTGLRKAAIVLLSLDKALAATLLGQMSQRNVEAVTLELARLQDVSPEEKQAVVDEFCQLGATAARLESGGMDYAQDLLEQSLGKERAGDILKNIRQSLNSAPFGFLQKIRAEDLAAIVQDEHPQTIALIVSHLPTPRAAELLAGLPSDRQLEVMRRVATIEQTAPEVVREVERSLEQRLTLLLSQASSVADRRAANSATPHNDRRPHNRLRAYTGSEEFRQRPPRRRSLVRFDDLLELEGRALQSVVSEVEVSHWAMALKGASEELRSRVIARLSSRAGTLLVEEMHDLGPVRIGDIEAAQQQVVDVLQTLEDAGVITLHSGTETEA